MEVFHRVLQFRSMFLYRVPHRNVPEDRVHGGSKQFAYEGAPDDPEKMKRLQLGKDCRRKQRQLDCNNAHATQSMITKHGIFLTPALTAGLLNCTNRHSRGRTDRPKVRQVRK